MAKYFIAVGFDSADRFWDSSYPCKTKKEAYAELDGKNCGVEGDSLRFIEIDLEEKEAKGIIDKAPVVKICATKKKEKK
jgi:hypothetical protein